MVKSLTACAAACVIILSVGNADAKKPVNPGPGPVVAGIDLAGGTFSIRAKEKNGITSVNNFSLRVFNDGDTDAPNSRIEFWLSDDEVLTTQTDVMNPTVVVDSLIHTQSLGKIKAGKSKKRTVGGGLLKQLSATSGQYIFAVMDSDNVLEEADEVNNVVFDQVP